MIFYREKFKAIRESLDLTQHDVAQHLGITRQSIQDWEDGKCNPRRPKIYKLAELFRCKPEEFANFDPGEYRENPIISPYESNKLAIFRKRANMSRKQLAKALGVPEYEVEAWETFAAPFDQNYNDRLQEMLNLTDAESIELIENTVMNPWLDRQDSIRKHRALRRGDSFRSINNEFAEAFRKKVTEEIIALDIDPVAKDTVLKIINKT